MWNYEVGFGIFRGSKLWVAPRESGTKEFSRPTFEYNFISLIPISKPFICSFSKISIYNFFLKLYLPTIHFWHILIERNRKEEQSFIWTNFFGRIAGKMLHITPTYVGTSDFSCESSLRERHFQTVPNFFCTSAQDTCRLEFCTFEWNCSANLPE